MDSIDRPSLLCIPKLKYVNSWRNAEVLLIVTSRKKAPPTAEELETKKQKQIDIKVKQVQVNSLHHEVFTL